MRWMLIFLLILNGIAYLWFSFKADNYADFRQSSSPVLHVPNTVTRLILLKEISEDRLRALSKGSTHSQGEGANSGNRDSGSGLTQDGLNPLGKPVCGLLGPFPEIVTARQFTYRLESLEIQAKLKSQSLSADPVYMVYLEPLASREQGLNLLQGLQAKRIDSYLITEGELKHGISLGFFRNKASAENVRQQRIEDGYDAELVVKTRNRELIWAMLQPAELGKISQKLLDQLLEDYEYLQKRQNFCDRVASLVDIE